ncbi:unnamed protein product [Caenorhabditis brenneri]
MELISAPFLNKDRPYPLKLFGIADEKVLATTQMDPQSWRAPFGGQAYVMHCPDDLVVNAKTSECQETCDDDDDESQDDAATTATTTPSPSVYPGEDDGEGYDEGSGETEGYYKPQATTEEPDTVDFDCSGLDNGNYADDACDYDCTAATTTTTTPSYVPTTTTAAPTTQADEPTYTSTPQGDSWKSTTSGWEESTTTSEAVFMNIFQQKIQCSRLQPAGYTSVLRTVLHVNFL